MTTYSDVSKNMNGGRGDIKSSVSEIKNVSFDGVWSGSAHKNLTGALETVLANADKQQTNLETFEQAMTKLQKYKENKIKIDELNAAISKIVIPTDDEEAAAAAAAQKAALEAERNATKQAMEQLKTVAKANVDRTFKLFS